MTRDNSPPEATFLRAAVPCLDFAENKKPSHPVQTQQYHRGHQSLLKTEHQPCPVVAIG